MGACRSNAVGVGRRVEWKGTRIDRIDVTMNGERSNQTFECRSNRRDRAGRKDRAMQMKFTDVGLVENVFERIGRGKTIRSTVNVNIQLRDIQTRETIARELQLIDCGFSMVVVRFILEEKDPHWQRIANTHLPQAESVSTGQR